MNKQQIIRAAMFNWKQQREAGVKYPEPPKDLLRRLEKLEQGQGKPEAEGQEPETTEEYF